MIAYAIIVMIVVCVLEGSLRVLFKVKVLLNYEYMLHVLYNYDIYSELVHSILILFLVYLLELQINNVESVIFTKKLLLI